MLRGVLLHSAQREIASPDCFQTDVVTSILSIRSRIWLRGKDLNQRPPGYEPDELPAALPRDILHHSMLAYDMINKKNCQAD